MWCKEIYSPILYKEISLEGKNVISNRKRVRSETYARQMNNNRPCDRLKERICAEKRKDIFIIKRRKRRNA